MTNLINAAQTGDISQVKDLLDTGSDVNEKNEEGVCALTTSAEAGYTDQ